MFCTHLLLCSFNGFLPLPSLYHHIQTSNYIHINQLLENKTRKIEFD